MGNHGLPLGHTTSVLCSARNGRRGNCVGSIFLGNQLRPHAKERANRYSGRFLLRIRVTSCCRSNLDVNLSTSVSMLDTLDILDRLFLIVGRADASGVCCKLKKWVKDKTLKRCSNRHAYVDDFLELYMFLSTRHFLLKTLETSVFLSSHTHTHTHQSDKHVIALASPAALALPLTPVFCLGDC